MRDFGKFFTEVHGYAPFPWQEALVERVAARGWPELIDVPTGLGKTAVLDVAVFLSAIQSRHARRRVFLVVDRRLIVDQAHEEATRIRQALDDASPGSICEQIRRALAITGDDSGSALDVTRMRGGLNWSWRWLERPDRHAIITGTVDQIGSRLLFRGYGVGEQLRPIDAALVGTDSLIIVDEAHLSDPLLTTLHDAFALSASAVGTPPIVVAMSASPDGADRAVHGITTGDEDDPVARRRLRAPKSLHPVSVAGPGTKAAEATAEALAYWAMQLGGPGKLTGVVANTVAMARAIFERIEDAKEDSAQCVLLTGRVRPIDREYLLAAWLPKIKSFAPRDPVAELYVVATQTIEAGADIDLDGLVSQAASLPATVQRLGRLNRLGDRDESHAVVIHTENLADPVYGSASDETWLWLASHAEPMTHKKGLNLQDLHQLDASPAALRARVAAVPPEKHDGMRGARPYVPVLSDSILRTWARTSPTPHPDVPVATYLHGLGVGEPTVSVIWRTDLPGEDPQMWVPSVEHMPPNANEAIEISVSALRRWLATIDDTKGLDQASLELPTSDLESQPPEEDPTAAATTSAAAGRSLLRVKGADKSEPVSGRDVRPGDVLVVPAQWGGCDRLGWKPTSKAKVIDLGDFAGGGRRAAVIRVGKPLTEAVAELVPDLAEQVSGFIAEVKADIGDEAINNARYRRLLREAIGDEASDLPHLRVLRTLARIGEVIEVDSDRDTDQAGSNGFRSVKALFAARSAAWNDDDSPAGSSISSSGKPITLASHEGAVARRAAEFATNLGLSDELVGAVQLAALFHDEGKRDSRFQVMLHRGDRWLAAAAGEPLAKSGMDPADRGAMRRAARASGYPPGMRHEAYSARIAEVLLNSGAYIDHALDGALDQDLVVHLVSTHHGWGRPLLPPMIDPEPCEIVVPGIAGISVAVSTANSVDWNGPTRFVSLCDKYGIWALALLETIVRLADIWCSARSEEI